MGHGYGVSHQNYQCRSLVFFKIHASWATIQSFRQLLFCVWSPVSFCINPSSTHEKHLALTDHGDVKTYRLYSHHEANYGKSNVFFITSKKWSLCFPILNFKSRKKERKKKKKHNHHHQLLVNKTEGVWTLTMHKVKTGFQTVFFNLNIASV